MKTQHENISIRLFIQKRSISLSATDFCRLLFTFSNFRACKSKLANDKQSVCLFPCLKYKNQHCREQAILA